MKNTYEVNQIIEFLKEKVEGLKNKAKDYENPIMQEMTKASVHLQFDFIRIKTELEAHENMLLTIQKFTSLESDGTRSETEKEEKR